MKRSYSVQEDPGKEGNMRKSKAELVTFSK
jgi:hypothetical protein